MTKQEIIRAWKEPSFRRSLDATQLAALPQNPAGSVELSEDELSGVEGGSFTVISIIYTIYTLNKDN